MENNFAQDFLKNELQLRQSRNKLYSLRAFARDLGIGVTSLSDFLAAKRTLSQKNIQKISCTLGLSPMQEEMFRSVKFAKIDKDYLTRIQLNEDSFRLISKWYYLAIMNLAKIKSNKSDKRWIARRLGLSVAEVNEALECLFRLGYIASKKGKLVRTSVSITTTQDIPSTAIQNHHRSNLRLAEKSLLLDPVEAREFSSTTLAIDPEQLKEGKAALRKARRKIEKALHSTNSKEVYVLSMQLFPVSRPIQDL